MTPYQCPGLFNIIPFAEHFYGVYHVEGGMSEIGVQLGNLFKEHGGDLRLNSPVKQLLMEKERTVKGVVLESGEVIEADQVIMNAEFAHNIGRLVPNAEQVLKRWKPSNLEKKKYSSSTFMLYAALDKKYDHFPVHNILFGKDFWQAMKDIDQGVVPHEPHFSYVRNASVVDPTLSPKGKSGLYFLVSIHVYSFCNIDTSAQFEHAS